MRPSSAGVEAALSAPVHYRARFDAGSLSAVRQQVRHHLGLTGLGRDRVDDFVVAVAEVLANAVEHGGGRGGLELRRLERQLSCDVSDEGPGMPAGAHGMRVAGPWEERGRGLWLAHAMCDKVIHHPSTTGTRITLMIKMSLTPGETFT